MPLSLSPLTLHSAVPRRLSFCQLCWTAPVAAQPATPHFPAPNVSLAYLAKLPSRSLAHCNCIRSTKQNNEPNPFPCTMSPVTSIQPPSVWSIPEPVLRNPASDVPPAVPPHALTPTLSLTSPAQGSLNPLPCFRMEHCSGLSSVPPHAQPVHCLFLPDHAAPHLETDSQSFLPSTYPWIV